MTVADVMTRELVTVTPETSVAEVAKTMHDQHIHRVLVVKGRELVGVITSFDPSANARELPPCCQRPETVRDLLMAGA